MAQKNKILIIVTSLVVIGSIGYYFFKKSKKESLGGGAEKNPSTDEKSETKTPEQSNPNYNPQNNVEEKYPTAKEFMNTTAKVKVFQDWLDVNYPRWLNGKKLNRGGGYGRFGDNTKLAWNTYKNQYIKTLGNKNTNLNNRNFFKGKKLIADIKFRAFANELRNGVWQSKSETGANLPSREFQRNEVVGEVLEVLNDGRILVKLDKYILSDDFGSNKTYSATIVKPNWVI